MLIRTKRYKNRSCRSESGGVRVVLKPSRPFYGKFIQLSVRQFFHQQGRAFIPRAAAECHSAIRLYTYNILDQLTPISH